MRRILFALFIIFLTAANLKVQKSPFNLSHGGWGNVHEKTHGVNSKLRQRYQGNCYYLWQDDQFVKFSATPQNITLSQVANRCQYKGNVFNLYMLQQQRYWNDTPLYPLDEWVSYTNGSISYIYSESSSAPHSICCMFELAYYSYVAIDTLPDTYNDKDALNEFWQYYARFNIEISNLAKQKKIFGNRQDDKYLIRHNKWRNIVEGLIL